MNEEELNYKLKSEFKHSPETHIYVSGRRPTGEVLWDKDIQDKCQVWDKQPNFLVCHTKLDKKTLDSNELKEYHYNFMGFVDRGMTGRVYLKLPELFDEHCFDLKESLDKHNLQERHIHTFFNEWNNLDDLDKAVKKTIDELERLENKN